MSVRIAAACLLAAAPPARPAARVTGHALSAEILGRGLAGARYDLFLGRHLGASIGLSWLPFTSLCFHCSAEQRRGLLEIPVGLGWYAPAGDSRFYLEPTLSVSASGLDLQPSLGAGYLRSFPASETLIRIGINFFPVRKEDPLTRESRFTLLPVPGFAFGFTF